MIWQSNIRTINLDLHFLLWLWNIVQVFPDLNEKLMDGSLHQSNLMRVCSQCFPQHTVNNINSMLMVESAVNFLSTGVIEKNIPYFNYYFHLHKHIDGGCLPCPTMLGVYLRTGTSLNFILAGKHHITSLG